MSEIEASDAQTHHDLGIAYMEMGLLEQAIAEFRIAAHNSQMEATAYNLIGNCLLSRGDLEEAVKELKMGLFAREKTVEQEMSLYYDIANAYMRIEDYKEALYYLENIKKKDPGYKDVSSKVMAITTSFSMSIKEPEKKARKVGISAASATAKESSKEIDDAFDELFGNFTKKK